MWNKQRMGRLLLLMFALQYVSGIVARALQDFYDYTKVAADEPSVDALGALRAEIVTQQCDPTAPQDTLTIQVANLGSRVGLLALLAHVCRGRTVVLGMDCVINPKET